MPRETSRVWVPRLRSLQPCRSADIARVLNSARLSDNPAATASGWKAVGSSPVHGALPRAKRGVQARPFGPGWTAYDIALHCSSSLWRPARLGRAGRQREEERPDPLGHITRARSPGLYRLRFAPAAKKPRGTGLNHWPCREHWGRSRWSSSCGESPDRLANCAAVRQSSQSTGARLRTRGTLPAQMRTGEAPRSPTRLIHVANVSA